MDDAVVGKAAAAFWTVFDIGERREEKRMTFQEFLAQLQGAGLLAVFVKLLMAAFFGGVIGLERETKRRPAGFRTFVLVCIGSTLAMTTNTYLCEMYGTGDPARIPAQVISGIGFLGAGTIIVTRRNQVKGLTTAAGLWACASMGLAIGAGFYSGAILGFVFIWGTVKLLHFIDGRIVSKTKVINLYIEVSTKSSMQKLISYIRTKDYKISTFEVTKTKGVLEGAVGILLELNLRKNTLHSDVIADMGMQEGVVFVEELK